MTSALKSLTSSSSDSTACLPALNLSTSKFPTTFIIQPPSSCQVKQSALLNKRCKPAELGDLLMKKIKSQTANSSEAGSQQQSPTLRKFEDPLYESSNCSKALEGLENTSMVDEIDSPSIKSFCDESEKLDGQKSFGNILMAQRSLSTPLISHPLLLKPFKCTVDDGHRQIQHALKVLEKKMMIEQQASALKEILLKIHRAQEPLNIPPLITPSDSTSSTIKKGKVIIRTGDDEQEVIYGDVEYPFLSQSMTFDENNVEKGFPSSSLALRNAIASSKSNDSMSSSESSPAYQSAKNMMDLDDSLTATRAETQRSESEFGNEKSKGRKGRGKKADDGKNSEVATKGKKGQKKEKTRGRKEKSPLLSPVRAKKSTERRKNKWQSNEETDKLTVTKPSSEKKVSKVKWGTLPQADEKASFFEGLRNLLNNNVDDNKSVTLP